MAPSSRYYEDKRQREEERRQRELERRKEEAAERQRAEEKERLREEERREEARREALEFEAALERARIKREETLARLRQQKQIERKEADREMQRRDNLLAALREANRDKEREEMRKERAKRANDRQTQQKETPVLDTRKEIPEEQKKNETRKEARALEARRRTALEEARKKASASRRNETERLDMEQAQKKQAQNETREQLARERLQERKREETESEAEEKRRADSIRKRTEELSSAQRAEERKAQALAVRKEEQQQELKEAARREDARRERLQEQKQERERIEREAERKEEQRVRRTQEKEERPKTQRAVEPPEKPASSKPLESRLPSGLLSGNLPWLLTYDNRIVTTEGEVVFLRGVNLPALNELQAAGNSGEATITEILSWGANVIRLGVSPARIIGGESSSRAAYLELLDTLVAAASAGNCYTIVHLFEDPAEPSADAPYLSGLLYDDVVAALRTLAERYASEPAVLLDLGYPPGDLLQGEASSRQTAWAAWNGAIPNLVADLRERHPRAFCFAGGLDRGTDSSGFPVTGPAGRPIPGLAYSASIRPGAADPWAQIGRLALSNPLFVSEWGVGTISMARDVAWGAAWGERVAVMMETIGIGWAAAFWGELAKPMQLGQTLLTPFGAVVKRALTRSGARAEASQLTRFSLTM
jgi:hypothetical protein